MAYRIRVLDAAADDLAGLDRPIGQRIVERLYWLAENLDRLTPQSLAGDLTGLFKLRVGDYRILYEILRDEQCIIVHQIGHRRDIYRRR